MLVGLASNAGMRALLPKRIREASGQSPSNKYGKRFAKVVPNNRANMNYLLIEHLIAWLIF